MIKICGLTKPEEAEHLNRNHVEFAGMVLFFPKSRRNISLEQAVAIKKKLNTEIRTVAVTVSPSLEQMHRVRQAGFDYIQIHGSMPDGWESVSGLPVIRALQQKELEEYREWADRPELYACLFDAMEPGSGQVFDWQELKKLPSGCQKMILAGGLNSDNVERAIECVRPDVVDISSGVEYTDRPGKDGEKIDRFVQAVRNTDRKNR